MDPRSVAVPTSISSVFAAPPLPERISLILERRAKLDAGLICMDCPATPLSLPGF